MNIMQENERQRSHNFVNDFVFSVLKLFFFSEKRMNLISWGLLIYITTMRFIRLKQPLKLHLVKYKKRKKKRNEAVVSRNFEQENFPVMWIQTSVKFYDSVRTIFHSQVTATSPICSTYYSFNKYTGDIKILSLQKTYLFLQQRPIAKVIKGALHNFHQTRRAWAAFDPNVFLPFLNGMSLSKRMLILTERSFFADV